MICSTATSLDLSRRCAYNVRTRKDGRGARILSTRASPLHVLFLKGLQCQNWQDDRPTNAGTCVSRFRLLLFVWVIVSGDITVKGHDIETIGALKRRYDKRGIGYQPAGDTRQSRIPESNEDTLLTLSCFGPM